VKREKWQEAKATTTRKQRSERMVVGQFAERQEEIYCK